MPTQDPYRGSFEEFTEPMWKEFVAARRPSGESVFNKRSGESALVGYVPFEQIKAAMRYMIGYEQVTNSAPFVLMRKNPIRHPYYEQLWCNGVAEHPFKPPGDNKFGPDPSRLKKRSKDVRTLTPPALTYYAGYSLAQLVLRFGPATVDFREDADPDYPDLSSARKEYLRNVGIDTEPRTETFETKLIYKFAEGAGCPAPYTNPLGEEVLAESGQILVKPDVVLSWKDVPENWIMKTATKKPTLILAALGTVNDADFLGHEKGTLLLAGAKLTRYPWTLLPRQGFGLPGADLESKYLYDVELICSQYSPEKGFTMGATAPVQILTNLGHNNFPRRGNVAAVPKDPNSGTWFFATLNGDVAGRPLYQYSSFPKIFDCPQNYP